MKPRFIIVFLIIVYILSLPTIGFRPILYLEEALSSRQAEAPVKGAGTEGRQWVTEKKNSSIERSKVKVDENIEIRVRDGIILKGRLLLPEGSEGPLPTIVQMNGYGHGVYGGKEEGRLIDLAERGYAVVHVSLRGAGTSGGVAGLYNSFGKDGYDVIEWAARQKWSNGKVGTTGQSLLGISQWLAAKELPPSLKAISPVNACTDCYDTLWYPGGMEAGPGRMARGIEYSAAKEHRNYDEWWKKRSLSAGQLEAIADSGIAAFISGGWNDYISPGNIEAYEMFSKAGGDSKLVVSAGAHTSLSGVMPYKFNDYQALWFDHYLKGEDNDVNERDPVLIFVQGANQWRYEEAWPLEDTNYVDLYLDKAKSRTIKSINDGSFSVEKPKDMFSVSYAYSPKTGPFLPALLSSSGRVPIDQRKYEEKTVTWTTDMLVVPTEVTGNMSLSFWAEANADDTDFVVQVADVAPNGTSKQVATGFLNATRSKSRTRPVSLPPGKVEEYTVDISPTSYVFKEGHRIRLSIAGGAKAHDGQVAPQGPGINPQASTVKIYQDAEHLSYFRLPIIGQETLNTRKASLLDGAIFMKMDNLLIDE